MADEKSLTWSPTRLSPPPPPPRCGSLSLCLVSCHSLGLARVCITTDFTGEADAPGLN